MKRWAISLALLALGHPSFAEFDSLDRLIDYPGKIEVECPKQDDNTGVILVIGQSNSANHAQTKFATRYPGQVFNYYNYKCYSASSPLLGTTGDRGEFMTPFADFLIEFGVYKKVVIVASGINGSKIEPWKKGGYLNNMLMDELEKVRTNYHLTEILWHQGESDFMRNTPPLEYRNSFHSLLSTLRNNEIKIPIYYAIATRCNLPWDRDNPIANMQRTFASDKDKIYLGADTDMIVGTYERIDGYCHFTKPGQLKTAYSFAWAVYKRHLQIN